MRTRFRVLLALLALASGAATASAVVSPIAPFYGEKFESFETKQLGFYPTDVKSYAIFDDQGGMRGLTTNSVGIANLVSDTRGYEITAHNGNFFAGTPIGALRIEFGDPVSAFGTWIGSAGFQIGNPNALTANGVAEFFSGSTSLGTQSLSVTVEQWKWHGWTSNTAFDAIELRVGEVPPGAPYESVLVDAMVASASSSPMLAPEPASLAALGLVGTALVRRRVRG